MSVSNQTTKVYGSGNGVTTTFSIPFKIFDVSQLVVYLINVSTGVVTGPKTLNVDYTATINTVTDGGTITFIVAPPTGTTWFVKRLVPKTQGAVIPSEGTLPGKQIENQLDLMTMMVIQVDEAVSRCAQLATTSLIGSVTLPDPVDGYALVWNGTSGALENVPFNGDDISDAVASATASAATASADAATATAQAAAAAVSAAAALATIVPTGVYFPFGGTVAPTGYLMCNQAVSRTTYAALFAVIGTAFGVGNGTTTFDLPSTADRFPIGKGSTFSTLGATGGAMTKDLSHTHTVAGSTGSGSGSVVNVDGSNTPVSGTGHTHSFSVTSGNGGSSSQDVTNSYVVGNYIIKT